MSDSSSAKPIRSPAVGTEQSVARSSGFGHEIRKIFLLFAKDMRIEWRSLDNIPGMFFFSLLVIVIFNFGFDFAAFQFADLGPGILWVAFTFSGVLSFRHSFALERDSDCLQGLMLAPLDAGSLYLGKLLANITSMVIVEAMILPLAAVLFNTRLDTVFWDLGLVVLVHTVGFAAVGTLFGALTARTRRGDVLLPILLFSVSIPLMTSAVKTTAAIFSAQPALQRAATSWLTMASVFDVIFITAAYLTFEYVIEE
ncbi:MAG: heme exporter protein CcmB [Acidobacteriota bacterium]